MTIDLLTTYIKDKDCYGFDFIKINYKSLLSIHYDSFYRNLSIELFFRVIK